MQVHCLRSRRTSLTQEEEHERDDRYRREHPIAAPVVARHLLQRNHQRGDGDDRQHAAEVVHLLASPPACLGKYEEAQHEHDHGDRDVIRKTEPHQKLPRSSPHQRTQGRETASMPDHSAIASSVPSLEQRRDDGQGRREEQSRGDAGQEPGHDQQVDAVGCGREGMAGGPRSPTRR